MQGMGAYTFIMWPIGSSVTPTFVSFRRPPTAESVLEDLQTLYDHTMSSCASSTETSEKSSDVNMETAPILFTPPSILEDLAALGSEAIDKLARLAHRVIYSGAPLQKAVGDELVRHGVQLVSLFGT
jgi:hypothetical protein